MTKTQINEYNNNASIFNFALYKLIITLVIGTLTIGALASFGVFKLVAYTENKKLAASQAALAEFMKDDLFIATKEHLDNPNPSETQKFIFSCLLHGTKKQRCEEYVSILSK